MAESPPWWCEADSLRVVRRSESDLVHVLCLDCRIRYRKELEVEMHGSDHCSSRYCWLADQGPVWSLPRLYNEPADGVEFAFVSRETVARVCALSHSYLSGREPSARIRQERYFLVVEKVAKEFPGCNPILLCWRVWHAHRAAALAHDDLQYSGPAGDGSWNGVVATMGSRSYFRRLRDRGKRDVLREVHVKIGRGR